jgi:hypothetical protein
MHRSTRLGLAALLFAALAPACSCEEEDGGGEPAAPTTASIHVRVTDLESGAAIAGARVLLLDADTGAAFPALVTDADGKAGAEIDPGGILVRVEAAGYRPRPLPGGAQVPVLAALGENAEILVQLLAFPGAGDGSIQGTVVQAGAGVPGALVVAASGAASSATYSGADGSFVLVNLAPGDYDVRALVQGLSGAAVSATAPGDPVTLELAAGGTGSVSGQVSFLATENGTVRVTLFDQASGEAVPGLSAPSSGTYSIEGVPPGTYVAWAALENETPVGYVMDPDAIRKFGIPVVTIAGTGNVDQPFDVTGAVVVTAPLQPDASPRPVLLEGTPTFSWEAYASADSYVVEVADELGEVVWGGFEGTTPVVEVGRDGTSIAYGAQGTAGDLVPGRTYRFRVYAKKADQREPGGYILISMSEDQRGLFQVQ